MSENEFEQTRIIGTCTDCGGAIFNVEPFERVGVQLCGITPCATRGVFRCAPCAIAARGRKITVAPSENTEPITAPEPLLL